MAGVGEEDWQEVEQGQHQDKVGAGSRAGGWVGEEDWQEVEQGQHQDKVGAGGRAVGWGGVGEEDGRRWSRVSNRIR